MNKQDICILHIIEQRYPRGAEIFANNLAHSLFLRGSNNIICNLYNSDSDSFTVLEGVNYLSINGRRTGITAKIGIQPSILLKLVKLIRKYKPDIIIAHGADTMKYTALAGQFYPQPLMVYKNISMASYWTDNPLKKLINSKLVRLFDAVISVSQITGEDFKKLHRISATKVFVIFNATSLLRYQALNIERERFQIRQNLGLKDKDNVLINVGSLTPEKNQGEILKLVKELAEMSPYLVLVGDGPLR
ncbi:MAG: glycosyltransferase, partial [Promethearchaeota archaeon]